MRRQAQFYFFQDCMLIFSTDKQSLSVPPFFSWALITDLFLSRAAYCILPTAYFS